MIINTVWGPQEFIETKKCRRCNETKGIEKFSVNRKFASGRIARRAYCIECEKKQKPVKIDDDFAKSLGAKDLNNLKELISKQINIEYKNSLDALSNKQILKEIEKIKVNNIPENLIQEEIKILTEGIKEEDVKKDKKKYENQAINRIKAGLILNAFGEENQIKVTEQELQAEIQKQLRMMPGQEKMIQEYYQNNPSLLANLKGSLYEEKIIKEIKLKAKPNKKEITKEQAEKLLKEENDKHLKEHSHHDHNHQKNDKKIATPKKSSVPKKTTSKANKVKKTKKVSKK